MTLQQSESFLTKWCYAVQKFFTPDASETYQRSQANAELKGIMNALSESQGIARLATNPLLLTILALVHRAGTRLPSKRIGGSPRPAERRVLMPPS